MLSRREAFLFATVAMAAAAMGCGGASTRPFYIAKVIPMSSELVDREGLRVLPASRSSVFAATAGALRVLGYSIAFADQASTVLKTEPMSTLTIASFSGSLEGQHDYRASARTNAYARSYSITFFDAPSGTLVRAAPRMYINGQDVSASPVWQLDGADGERAQWERLFREIASNLQPAPTVPNKTPSAQIRNPADTALRPQGRMDRPPNRSM